MTRALKASLVTMTALVVVTACVLLIKDRLQPPPLSLVFERYSTRSDFYVSDMAFLWLTNSSGNSYWLEMTGGTNTFELDTPLALRRSRQSPGGSYLVSCEFSDQAQAGSPNLFRRAMSGSAVQCLTLAPHSAVRIRVARPPSGQSRRVAALCLEPPPGTRPFWTDGIGLKILRLLPRSAAKKVMLREPSVIKVWCDHELTHQDASRKE